MRLCGEPILTCSVCLFVLQINNMFRSGHVKEVQLPKQMKKLAKELNMPESRHPQPLMLRVQTADLFLWPVLT